MPVILLRAVAGSAYRRLVGREYDTVVVLGPSHYADLRAASVTNAAVFPHAARRRADLREGRVAGAVRPICPGTALLRATTRVVAAVFPGGARNRTADTWEHSVEVEIPFLQKTLKGFQLSPW